MIRKIVICPYYGHFEKKLRSEIVSQNHYLNQILDVHALVAACFGCGSDLCYMEDV